MKRRKRGKRGRGGSCRRGKLAATAFTLKCSPKEEDRREMRKRKGKEKEEKKQKWTETEKRNHNKSTEIRQIGCQSTIPGE